MNLIAHDFHHLLSDGLDVRALGVASGLHLSASSLGESNAEETEQVSILGLGLHEALDQGVPLLDQLAELVLGDVHAIEVRVAVKALHFLDLDLHLSPVVFLAPIVQIS